MVLVYRFFQLARVESLAVIRIIVADDRQGNLGHLSDFLFQRHFRQHSLHECFNLAGRAVRGCKVDRNNGQSKRRQYAQAIMLSR